LFVEKPGGPEASFSRVNRVGSKADKQLVHQPEEAALEAL